MTLTTASGLAAWHVPLLKCLWTSTAAKRPMQCRQLLSSTMDGRHQEYGYTLTKENEFELISRRKWPDTASRMHTNISNSWSIHSTQLHLDTLRATKASANVSFTRLSTESCAAASCATNAAKPPTPTTPWPISVSTSKRRIRSASWADRTHHLPQH